MTKVFVYTTSTCPWCRRAKDYLADRYVSFKEINVVRDKEAAAEMVQETGQSAVPVMKIGETWIVGFHPPTIEGALRRAGLGARHQ
jgi:glutaredoxin 3